MKLGEILIFVNDLWNMFNEYISLFLNSKLYYIFIGKQFRWMEYIIYILLISMILINFIKIIDIQTRWKYIITILLTYLIFRILFYLIF